MAINFPNNPSTDDTFTSGDFIYEYDGTKWVVSNFFSTSPSFFSIEKLSPSGSGNIGNSSSSFDTVFVNSASVSEIEKTGTDGVGNIGSSSNSFDTVFAKATSAQYADVAERYISDAAYSPATVVKIGGDKEITASTNYADSRVAGVITTNPAFLMNKDLTDEYIADVALTGRVPCKVVGEIEKGDLITTSDITGVATALLSQDFVPGCIIGKALENYHSDAIGIIEVLVGRV